MLRNLLYILGLFLIIGTSFRCGQPLPPTGGMKDTIPPNLIRALPKDSATNTIAKKIILEFDEYVQLQEVQQQLVVSPVPKIQPLIESKLRTVTISIKDTLQDNTTYSFNFGNSLQDINENNPLKNFTYVFSTGSSIDSGNISGQILIAETGKPDSTILAILHPDLSDTAVVKKKPKYMTRLNGEGFFTFRYVAPGTYNLFALKDADGGLKFDQTSELFGFLDKPVTISGSSEPVRIYTFQGDEEPKKSTPPKPAAKSDDKRLKYSTTDAGSLDILKPLILTFERKPAQFDSNKIYLATDSGGKRIPASISLDSNIVMVKHDWEADAKYKLYIEKGLASDTLGFSVLRNDTIQINTKKTTDYGSLLIRVTGLDTTKHPVLLFFVSDVLKNAVPIKANRVNFNRILPGDYQLRILYDKNQNGKWDSGDYNNKRQPEIVIPRKQTLNIRPNWDNEVDINMTELENQG
ncbi:MAG: Ig-like domain-containing domain [Sphingobacteriales bacterium]|jgi:uncharacterized protein (DUF2141 family)